MAIDYLLEVDCAPQQSLGVEQLVALSRTRIIARSALAHMRDDGDERDPSEIEVQLTMRKPTGDSARGVTLQDLLDEARPLDEHTPACASCPAKLAHELGCHRRIRYPISEETEAWLMSRLPETLGCTAGALLVRALGEFGWDGEPTAKLRASGTTFFASRAPYGVRWQGDDGTIEISSDQLFQMMFMVGHLAPAHSLMLALFTGAIPHDTSLHALQDKRTLEAANVPVETDPELEQMAAFLRMLVVAVRHDATIRIDG